MQINAKSRLEIIFLSFIQIPDRCVKCRLPRAFLLVSKVNKVWNEIHLLLVKQFSSQISCVFFRLGKHRISQGIAYYVFLPCKTLENREPYFRDLERTNEISFERRKDVSEDDNKSAQWGTEVRLWGPITLKKNMKGNSPSVGSLTHWQDVGLANCETPLWSLHVCFMFAGSRRLVWEVTRKMSEC